MAGSNRSMREEVDRGLGFIRRSLTYWKRTLLVLVIGTAISVPYAYTRPRVWKSEMVILYSEPLRADATGGGEAEGARRLGARLREVLLSRTSCLEPIIREMNLSPKGDPRSLIEAVDDTRKRVTFRAREGDTYEISYQGGSPEEAQEVTRRLGGCIIADALRRQEEQAKATKEFLTGESERSTADLKTKEAELAKFVSLHPALAARLRQPGQVLPPMPGATTAPTTTDPILASLEGKAARIERQLAKTTGAREPPPAPAPKPVFVAPPDSPELVAARKDLADKQSRFTEKHPDVIAAKNRLRAAEEAQAQLHQQALDAHAAAIVNAARVAHDEPPPKNAADEAALRQQLGDLQGQIAARRAVLAADAGAAAPPLGEAPGSAVALEVDFRRLEREVAEARERQRSIDERLFKALITERAAPFVKVSVLDPAYLPMAPISKSRSLTLAGFLAVVLVLALAVALISTKLDDRIYDELDLERVDILPIVGVIPRAELPPKR
jgi:uncharacterized protein involved in exopolysaccharide biosynthesis